jgi:hypothetical protein
MKYANAMIYNECSRPVNSLPHEYIRSFSVTSRSGATDFAPDFQPENKTWWHQYIGVLYIVR